ncbi:Vacuolar protein sorting/targeting protein 10 [Thelohanellus kitauei]|uniref:Vacuolar protein sorting/targeting protein 10 n=1 Tax=Thelohanellus kitauei TaxID=669202 RepID=A0A0C2N083_THEKT|nr:Vacuolar protein sorting/targeting protein 10 [Thelohanellus kitauei]
MKEINKFTYAHSKYYIVFTTKHNTKCLFTNIDDTTFVEITCELDTTKSIVMCPVVIHPYIPGFIFANIKKESQSVITYISTNNGKDFVPVKVSKPHTKSHDVIALNLPCEIDLQMNFPVPWISVFREKCTGKFPDEIVSIDGGITWSITPFPIYRISVLHQGGIFIGIHPSLKKVMYSFGSRDWYIWDFFYPDENIRVFAHNSYKPSTYLNLIATKSGEPNSVFIYLDFSNILNRKCLDDDYEIWSPLKNEGLCWNGRKIEFLRIKPNTYCFANKTYDVQKIFKLC